MKILYIHTYGNIYKKRKRKICNLLKFCLLLMRSYGLMGEEQLGGFERRPVASCAPIHLFIHLSILGSFLPSAQWAVLLLWLWWLISSPARLPLHSFSCWRYREETVWPAEGGFISSQTPGEGRRRELSDLRPPAVTPSSISKCQPVTLSTVCSRRFPLKDYQGALFVFKKKRWCRFRSEGLNNK